MEKTEPELEKEKMKLIKDFKSNSFLKVAWVNKKSKDKWDPIIKQLATMVHELEIESVAAGQRRCAWSSRDGDDYLKFTKECAEKDLLVLPAIYTGKWQGFAHQTVEYIKGKPFNVSCIVARTNDDLMKFYNAYHNGDHITQGDLLGFPDCCIEFFNKHWMKGFFDPMWQIALNSDGETWGNVKRTHIKIHPYSNPILRYLGLRIGFHIPCSFNCEKTIELSKERMGLIKDNDIVYLLNALLSMPMEWNVYHGIAIVKTPIFYLIYNSVPSMEKYTININGSFYPKEGAPHLKEKKL